MEPAEAKRAHLSAIRRRSARIKKLTEEQETAVVAAYQEHQASLDAIAASTGMTRRGIRLMLKRHGVETRDRGRPKAKPAD